jgi:hypothetical protein
MAWRSRGRREGDVEWRAGSGGDALMLGTILVADVVGDELHVMMRMNLTAMAGLPSELLLVKIRGKVRSAR